jgi:LysR family hydrogen peroxide-inducible transcriptional activator
MFLNNFIKKHPKVKLIIEELNTEEIITKLKWPSRCCNCSYSSARRRYQGNSLYFEPFVAYIPEGHQQFQKEEINISDLNVDEILLLQDGHCFRDGILNLCK